MGGKLARLHGIDLVARKKALTWDRFSRASAAGGYREPYIQQRTETA